MSFEHSPNCDSGDAGIERVRVRFTPDERTTRRGAAEYLGVAEKTLAMWQSAGRGPKSVKVGGRRFYFRLDLDAFIQREP